MNSNKVNIRAFAAILGFLFLALGTAFASSSKTCRSDVMSCCAQGGVRNAECAGLREASQQPPAPNTGSCCTTITSTPRRTPVAVLQQDNGRDNRAVSDGATCVALSAQVPQVRSLFHGRLDLFDSHPRTSVAKYVLSSTFLI